ncbi:MAG: hypothetical protein EOP10_05695 [Proteobacteria bacterium]|nr:MAG: hypothetical protein EOP10_05695 [Pseudomonadota bacterium]
MIQLFGLILLILVGTQAQAFPLRHRIQITDSINSLQTQGLCFSFFELDKSIVCGPWASEPSDSGSIGLSALFKADEQGLKIANRVNNKDLDQEFISDLFREDNFHDASGLVEAKAIYQNLSLSLIPLHVSGAYKVNNPSLPEVHLVATNSARIGASYIWLPKISNAFHFLLSPTVFHMSTALRYGDFTALDTATTTFKNLIKVRKVQGVDADLALGVVSKIWWVPSLTLRGQNLFQTRSCLICKESFFEVDDVYLPQTSGTLSWSIRHAIGDSIFGIALPYGGIFEELNEDNLSYSYSYRLSRLQSFVAFSPLKSSFGFLLNTGHYQLGIQYAYEIQSQAISRSKIKQAYVFAGLDL